MTRFFTPVLMLGLAVLVTSCSKPISRPSTMSETESKKLTAALERLDSVLKTNAPAIHSNLRAGADEDQIVKIREALGGNKVEVLEVWFRWRNGSTGNPSSLLPLGFPISVSEALADRKMLSRLPVGKLRKSAVKILDDGAGDGYFLDVTSTEPLVFYDMLEDPGPEYYGTLAEFVTYIADGFESGAVFVNSSSKFDFDDQKFDAHEEAHLAKATTPQ